MYVAVVPNRKSPPAVLLRESFREEGKVKNRTLANLSDWPSEKVEALRAVLRGDKLVPTGEELEIVRSMPHGHVQAVLGMAKNIGLDRLLPPGPKRKRDLALALILARLIDPASKLATARALDEETASHSLGSVLNLGKVRANEVYDALDWLVAQQPQIEKTLARRHLKNGALVLYDLTSTWLEGRCCPLAQHGYSRDHRADKLQIVFGLLCSQDGCPIAVEVFAGNVADPATLKTQIDKLKTRFELSRVVLVGDRGMITEARLREDIQPNGLDWVTALRAPQIQALAADNGPLQLSLFDERDLVEIESPDFPGERLIVCRNPALAVERARKRGELLDATERDLEKIKARVALARNPLKGAAQIGQAVGAVLSRCKVGKHFQITITDNEFSFARDTCRINAEVRLDGLYVLRTSLPTDVLDTAQTVLTYKSLRLVESAFRSIKAIDIEVRPVFHWAEERVRAHVLLCMLAYYIEWHMRQALATILFDDHDRASSEQLRSSPVAKAQASQAARRKATTKTTDDGLPVHSFRSLLSDLGTLTRNTVRFGRANSFTVLATPTPVQQRAFSLLCVNPAVGL